MANEITIQFYSFALSITNYVTIESIDVKENKSVSIKKIPKTDGGIAEEAKRDSLTISVSGDVSGSDYDALRTNLDALKAALHSGISMFVTDDDRYIMAQIKDFSYSYKGTLKRIAKWTASFVAHYPFWLARAATTDTRTPTSGVGYTVTNAGNAPARAKITVTAPAGGIADACQLENTTVGLLCKYRGTIAETKVLEIDNRYDTDDFQVLNDGNDDVDNFEGDFIYLNPGANTIEYTGTADASVTVTFRAAYY